MDVSPVTCNAEQLFHIVSSRNRNWLLLSLSNPAMTEDHVIALLRNSYVTTEIVQSICDRLDWMSSYRVQVALANCVKTPFSSAMRLLQMLFWNDLLRTAVNYRLSPQLRRVAENYLREKVPALTLGEKIALCRNAPRSVIPLLRVEKEQSIIQALLRNPHLVEEDLLAMVNAASTSAATLTSICRDQKWAARYPIRLALVRNERTPLAFALSFLTGLQRPDLESLMQHPRTRELVRRTAHRLLTGQY